MNGVAHKSVMGLSIQRDGQAQVMRNLPLETAVAISVNGTTHAVMMASPTDLRDFAIGFAHSEGILTSLDQIETFDLIEHDTGIEAQFWLKTDVAEPFLARRRAMAGPVGCGLCGIDSLDQAVRALPQVQSDVVFSSGVVARACDDLRGHQPLHDITRAVHGVGFLTPDGQMILSREDVGRHNALDKVIGALIAANIDPASGAMVLTSRVSIEMVQKTAMAGCAMIIAVSAPTTHALKLAQDAGITLCTFARNGGFDCYAHPQRIKGISENVA